MVYSDQMAKNEQLNFYVNYEGKFGKHSIAAMAAVEKTAGLYAFQADVV